MKKRISLSTFFIVIIAIALIISIGKLLDFEDERVINQLYPRDQNGVIEGLSSRELKNHNQTALIIIHGMMSSPEIFTTFFNDEKNKNFDIYIPLLPYHGRSLEEAKKINNKIITKFISKYINDLAKKYKKVVILGHSYGGTQLLELYKEKNLPQNSEIILYAPAIYTKSDYRIYLYSWWRDYCNYEPYCSYRNFGTENNNKDLFSLKERNLRYRVLNMVLAALDLDAKVNKYLAKINQDFTLILARDDARVNAEQQEKICIKNKHCKLVEFADGNHNLHVGKNRDKFNKIIEQII